MTAEQRQIFWQDHIESWRQSGLSQRAYCQQANISFSAFGYWRSRLKGKVEREKKFIPLAIPRPSASVTISLPTGVRLEVPVHALAEVLRSISRASKGAS